MQEFIEIRDTTFFFSKFPPFTEGPELVDSIEQTLNNESFTMESICAYDDDQLSRSIFIESVDPDMCEFLEVVLENKRKGGGSIEEWKPDEDNGGVLVIFEQEEGRQIVHNFSTYY